MFPESEDPFNARHGKDLRVEFAEVLDNDIDAAEIRW